MVTWVEEDLGPIYITVKRRVEKEKQSHLFVIH
jgi:hypothetical protein